MNAARAGAGASTALWVCLLRGVNLGSHNKLNMAQLRAALEKVGFTEVQTYLQSGNVILRSSAGTADQVSAAVRAVLADGFDLNVPVIMRTPRQLRDVEAWCPFRSDARERPTAVHLLHLADRPDRSRVAAFVEEDWGPDAVAVRGVEVAIRYATSMHRSRLQHSTILRRLGVDGTARNWRTLVALLDRTTTG